MDKKKRVMVEMWKKGILVRKKGRPCTTPSPTWRLELPSQYDNSDDNNNNNNNKLVQEFLNFSNTSTVVSARKLCANLWQIQHSPFAKMNKHGGRGTTLRSRRRHYQLFQPADTPYDQPPSANSIRRHLVTSRVRRHRSVDRNVCALQPASPSCYSSSVEVAPYKCAATPISSLDCKGIIKESSYSVTTSTELLNVLNRIWSLEEQNASNKSAVKDLKMELDRSQTRMKELVRGKQMNKQEMESLMKQMTVEKFVRKNREDNRIKAAVKSLKEELVDERMLRKKSESLHRKLARELSEVKSSFSGCLRNLERERKARILLENLCDEFAKGIKDYEQEVHCLRQNSENVPVKGNSVDRLILHISEAWLDERTQMKLAQSDSDFIERISIVDKLGFDIETFLHAKRCVDLKKYGYSSPKELKEIYPCQHSIDTFPLQDAAQENSIDNYCFEPKETTAEALRKLSSEPQINNATKLHQESNEEENQDSQKSNRPWTKRMNSSEKQDIHIVGKSFLSSEGGKVHPETICREDSCVQAAVTTNSNPIKQWKSKFIASDFDKTECSTKLPKEVKENTFIELLLEARQERQRIRSKASKSTS